MAVRKESRPAGTDRRGSKPLFMTNWCICLGQCPIKTLYIRKVTKIKLMRLTFTAYFRHVRACMEGAAGSQLSLTIMGITILPTSERGRLGEGNALCEITDLGFELGLFGSGISAVNLPQKMPSPAPDT